MRRRPAGYPVAVSTPERQPPPWRAVFAGARGRLTIGLLLLEALVAVEIMVVATILPAVEADLHGLKLYGWIYAALTLASIGSVPIAGRMTDRLGPRPILGISIAFYVVGLVLAATAPTMFILVVARFVQGIGGGGLYTVSLGTVAKTYPQDIRPRVMALLASMWILPGLVGPPIGALINAAVGWRWVFVAPLPVIVLAAALVMPALRNVQASEERSSLPIAASLVLMVGVGSAARRPDGPVGLERPARGARPRDRDPGAPQDHAARNPRRPPRTAGGVRGRVPRVGGVLRHRRVRHADAHAGPRAVGRRRGDRADLLGARVGARARGGSPGSRNVSARGG